MMSAKTRGMSILLITAAAMLSLPWPMTAAGQDSAPPQTAGKTMRVYFMGSSLTDQVKFSAFQKLAESRGHKHIYGRHSIPGAPIRILWGARDSKPGGERDFGSCGPALGKHTWDALTLEPRAEYDKELQAANELIDYATKHSPQLQVYIFAQWPRKRGGSFDKQWLSGAKDIQNNIRYGFECFLDDVRKAVRPGVKPPLMIPVGHAFHLFDLKCQAGLAPGMKSIYDGYSDSSHQNHLGEYIVGCTFYATIYGESPIGLPTEPYGNIPPDLARVMQETAWEAVNAHPKSGVKAPGDLKIITPYLPDAIEGCPYERELHWAFGQAPVTFSLAGGNLPPGFIIKPEGYVSGQNTKIGSYEFTVQARDASGKTAERAFKMRGVAESRPVIVKQTIPPLRRGQFVSIPFQVEGGNGDITWRVENTWIRDDSAPDGWRRMQRAGRPIMPPGLTFMHTGALSGAVAVEGVYRIQTLAEDSDPVDPDSARAEFEFHIAPAGPDVYLVPEVSENPTIDGKLDESFWKINQPITKVASGKPSCKASFGAVWYKSQLNVAIKVEDAKVVDASKELADGDSVEVFVDWINDREKEYNSDDQRYIATVGGQTQVSDGVEARRFKAASTRSGNGYIIELQIGKPSINKVHKVYGFDIAINDNDGAGAREGQLVWQGSADNATDPSGFGTIILTSGNE